MIELGHLLIDLRPSSVSLVCIAWRGFSLHLGVRRPWTWGYVEDWYDGPIPSIGAGPVFLFNWLYSLREAATWES